MPREPRNSQASLVTPPSAPRQPQGCSPRRESPCCSLPRSAALVRVAVFCRVTCGGSHCTIPVLPTPPRSSMEHRQTANLSLPTGAPHTTPSSNHTLGTRLVRPPTSALPTPHLLMTFPARPLSGPAPAGSRGTLRMNGVGERETRRTGLDRAKSARERERERERKKETRPGSCSRVWQLLYLSPSPLYPKLVHF